MDKQLYKKAYQYFIITLSISTLVMGLLTGCASGSGSDSISDSESGTVISEKADGSTVVMTIEDHQVTLSEVYLFLIQYCYNSSQSSALVDETTGAAIINSTIDEIKLETVEYLLALNMEVKLSVEELEQAQLIADTFYQYFGESFLSRYGIDYEQVKELFVRQAYINGLGNKAREELAEEYKAQYEKDFEDRIFHSVYYVLFPSIQYDEAGNPVMDEEGGYALLSEEELAIQRAKAEELREKVLAGTDMETLAEEYGIAAYSGIERNYDGAYEQSLNDAIAGMEKGDISEVIETEAGYMVVRMDNNNDEDYKEYLISYMAAQSANSLFPSMQENWITQSGVESIVPDEAVLSGIDVSVLCKDMEESGLYQ